MSLEVAQSAEWLPRMRGLAPLTARFRDACESERQLPSALFEALRDAHVFRMSTPRAVGGLELDEVTAVASIEELSRQDGAVGWNVMVASNTAMIASYLPEAGRRALYRAGPSTVVAGALLPKGAAKPVANGFRLTGRWTMASGCQQADWMVGCSVVFEDGAPRRRPDGSPESRAFFVSASQCQIIDTWQTTGLRGTGSHDWEVRDLFVPEEHTFPVLLTDEPTPGALLVKDFAAYAVARVAAVTLGIARDAIESFLALACEKTPTAGTKTLASQHVVHERVGRAEALVRAGRALLFESVRALPESATWSAPLTDDQRATIRLAGAHAAQNAVEAVDLMFHLAGTSGIFAASRLDRCFRDVHVAANHVNVASSNVEMVGQHMLGLGLHFRR